MIEAGPGREAFNTLECWLRCRRCDHCRSQRAAVWRVRAVAEHRAAVRTWFGTLTFKPEQHMQAINRLRVDLAREGTDYDALPYGEQVVLHHQYLQKSVTDFFKRLRKRSQSPIRYLLVMEAHKSGWPHYHVLIHESDVTRPIPKTLLEMVWTDGFCHWRLVKDDAQCAYVAKYLSKTLASRVRASLSYGVVSHTFDGVKVGSVLGPRNGSDVN